VDVRVISATNKNILEEVRAGRFREDLLYRLNVITLTMPLLRERTEDIPILAQHFLARKSRSRTVKRLSPEAVRVLTEHPWPGNVRELEHVIEGAILLSSGETIEPKDLSLQLPRTAPQTAAGSPPALAASATTTLEEIERNHIERVLRENGFNRTRSALALGISKKTLYLKIKRFGLDVQE
jgi:DNA-binding NtrC family response regulator